MTGRLFTSESVTEGHPDKIADQISDSILMLCWLTTRRSRVAVETLLTTGLVVVAGEVTTKRMRRCRTSCGGVCSRSAMTRRRRASTAARVGSRSLSGAQSADIAQGVDDAYEERHDHSVDPLDRQGAGDQGLMFGYACDETAELMPLPIMVAHRLAERLTQVRKDGTMPYLRPDGKTQVTIEYDGDRPVRVDTVVVSSQHAGDIDIEAMLTPDVKKHVVDEVLASGSTSMPATTGCWSTRPAGSSSAVRWATPG